MIDQVSGLFIGNGVTSVRDMGGKLEDITAFRDKANQPNAVAPHVWIAGPIIDGSPPIMKEEPQFDMPDISVTVDSPEEARVLVDELVKHGIDFIKGYEMLRPDVFRALIKQAQNYDLQAAGHLPIRMTIPEVLAAGPYDIQHLGGVCSGIKYECALNSEKIFSDKVAILENRGEEDGAELMMKILSSVPVDTNQSSVEKRAELIQLFVENNTWHTPTLVNGIGFRLLGLERDEKWLSAFGCLSQERQKIVQTFREKEITNTHDDTEKKWTLETVGLMHKAGVKFLAGTDCPASPYYTPGLALHYELRAMVLAGLSPLEALQTATINPAKFFDISDECGSIEVGKIADIVLLEADPLADINNSHTIAAVILRGRVFDQQALDKILEY